MKARGFGRVLFNGSRAALGVPTRTAYSATKAGIIGMARTWALELAPHGITVNVVAAQLFVVEHLLARCRRTRPAGVEDHGAVGELQRAIGVLLDDDGGDALLLDDAQRLSISCTITGARPS
jgi:NAD(P)-dependent dehydrogenase (short-subunit alcohol dehydrogenase family)